jgi:hypothetical protein
MKNRSNFLIPIAGRAMSAYQSERSIIDSVRLPDHFSQEKIARVNKISGNI